MDMQSNVLVKGLAGLAILIMFVAVFKSCSGGSQNAKVSDMQAVPQTDQELADQDSTAETINTLTAKVQELIDGNEVLKQENKYLKEQKSQIEESVKKDVTRQMESDVKQQVARNNRENEGTINDLYKRLEELNGKLLLKNEEQNQASLDNSELPMADLGLDGKPNDVKDASDYNRGWLMPTDMSIPTGDKFQNAQGDHTVRPLNDDKSMRKTSLNTQGRDMQAAEAITPQYTVPVGGTLLEGTSFTALLGRIPINNKVVDPFPFKILVGKENLAARGIKIPNLSGMIFGGIASGDWNLSCVRGRITYATYVFDDGRISTYEPDENSTETKTADVKGIGYISDKHGIPCITGELKSNAAKFLASNIGLAAFETAGAAYAAANTTTQFNANGGATTSIDEIGDFTLGTAIEGGARETRNWVKERQSQSFEAIFAPPGLEIAINVTREIPIDIDLNERKVSYGNKVNPYKTTGLD